MRILKERTLFSSLIDLLGKDHSRRYKGEEGKETADFERLLKKNWNYSADRNFIESIKLVHWFMSGDPSKFLGTSHRDEVSAEGYLPAEPMISNFTSTQVGVLLDGYVTFAMRSGGGTGFFGGDATPEKWKSSGMVKRAPAGKANFKHKLILNKDSRFRDKGAYNEFIVDNWKPTALIAKGGINNPFYKELYNYSVENNLPVIDENGDQVELQDPAEFSAGKKISTGFGRLARGALPEGEKMKMKITKSQLKQIIKEEIESDPALLAALSKLTDTMEELDISIDFLAAAVIGGDPLSIGSAQRTLGRAYRPSKPAGDSPKLNEDERSQMVCKSLRETIAELQFEKDSGATEDLTIQNQIDVLENVIILKGCMEDSA